MISKSSAERTEKVVLDWEKRPGVPARDLTSPPQQVGRPCIRAILLEDLVNEGHADCSILIRVDDPTIQKIYIAGDAVGGTFTLGFKGQVSDKIKWDATAAELQAILEKLETIGAGNVSVSIGDQPGEAGAIGTFPAVWLVEFVGKFAEAETAVPLLTGQSLVTGMAVLIIATTQYADSGTIETANAGVPVGHPTPMRAGAVALLHWIEGEGYTVGSLECREFHTPYDSVY
jgi:hypothetical protein